MREDYDSATNTSISMSWHASIPKSQTGAKGRSMDSTMVKVRSRVLFVIRFEQVFARCVRLAEVDMKCTHD